MAFFVGGVGGMGDLGLGDVDWDRVGGEWRKEWSRTCKIFYGGGASLWGVFVVFGFWRLGVFFDVFFDFFRGAC